MTVMYMTTGLNVRVSSRHKRDGVPNDFHNCALALAIKDMPGVVDVVVGRAVVTIKYADGTFKKYHHSANSRRLVAVFDAFKNARSIIDPKAVVVTLNAVSPSQHPAARTVNNRKYRVAGAAKPYGPRVTKPKNDPLSALGVRNGSSAPAMSI